MFEEDRPIQFFKCRKCGRSMDDDESTWMIDVKWPIKLKVKKDGSIGYMLAEMKDEDILQRLDLSLVICDECHSKDVEVKEWDTTPDWAVAAKEKKSDDTEEKAPKDE